MCTPPAGKRTTHSPPDTMVRRSIIAGPKNQLVKAIQTSVTANHFHTRLVERVEGGLDANRRAQIKDVHPHARLMKSVFRMLDLRAK